MKVNVDSFYDLAKDWQIRLNRAQSQHYYYSEQFMRINDWISSSVVVLTTFTSCSFLAQAIIIGFDAMPIKIGALAAFIAAILTRYMGFKKHKERAEVHRKKATEYGALKRELEIQFAGQFQNRDEAIALFTRINQSWNEIAKDSPVTPIRIINHIKSMFDKGRTGPTTPIVTR